VTGSSSYVAGSEAITEGKEGILDGKLTPEQAAFLVGGFTLISERLFLGGKLEAILKPVLDKGAAATLASVGKAGVKEALQEGLETIWENLIAKLSYNDATLIFAGILDSVVGGFGGGSIATGGAAFYQGALRAQVKENEQRRYLWNEKMKREFFAMMDEDGKPLYDATTINGLLELLERFGAAQNFNDKQMDKMFTLITGRDAPVDPTELAAMVTERSALAKKQGWVDVKLYSTKHVVRCYVTILTPAEEGPNQVLGSGLKVNP